MSEINAEVGVIGVAAEIQHVVVNPVVAMESAPAALSPIMTAEQTQSFIDGDILHDYPSEYVLHPINSVLGMTLQNFIQTFI